MSSFQIFYSDFPFFGTHLIELILKFTVGFLIENQLISHTVIGYIDICNHFMVSYRFDVFFF